MTTGTLELISPDTVCASISESLRACYDSNTKALTALKEEIADVQPKGRLKYCPMCGVTKHSTFDHYLPSVDFPEFSVHPANLVPCCAQCNSIKDDFWLDQNGDRYFLHAYGDDIPIAQYLHVELRTAPSRTSVGAVFKLRKPNQVSAAAWRLLSSHYDRLHLLDRYNDQGNDEINEVLVSCKVHFDSGGDPQTFLQKVSQGYLGLYGENHWRVVLIAAMAEHEDLLNWIEVSDQ